METSEHPAGPKDEFPHTFAVLERKTTRSSEQAASAQAAWILSKLSSNSTD
jgi:hypothetical protein